MKYVYRNPRDITTEEEYMQYVINETKERNERHRKCLELLGIGVYENISKEDPTEIVYSNMIEKNLATCSNVIPFSKESAMGSYDLIPTGLFIDLRDGTTIEIIDDFDEPNENDSYKYFVTHINVYNTEDLMPRYEDGEYKLEDAKPVVTASYSNVAEKNNPTIEVSTPGVEMIISDNCFTFVAAQNKSSRKLEYDGQFTSYIEEVGSDGNDKAKGFIELLNLPAEVNFRAGVGDSPKMIDFKKCPLDPEIISKAIISSERAKELMNKAIEVVELRLGNRNKFRKKITKNFKGFSAYLNDDGRNKQEGIEEIVDQIKLSSLDFGKDVNLFKESDPSKLIL